VASHADVIASVQSGDVEAVRSMLKENPALASARDANGVSALMYAFYYRRGDLADLLLAAKPDVDIFEAAAGGKPDRISAILHEDPEATKRWSPDGFTALHFAAFFNRPAIARQLIRAGAEPSVPARNPMKVTPLHSAAAAHSSEIVQLLLEHGAPPNLRQQGGWTPLHEAAQIGDLEMLNVLLKHGADPHLRSDDGRTPVEMAKAKGQDAAVNLLEQHAPA
jgi:ankyrin repeat protein